MRREDKPTHAASHVYFSEEDRTRKKRNHSGGSTSSTGSEGSSTQRVQPPLHNKLKRALSENYQMQSRPLVVASNASGFSKLKLLLWKNWVVQKRHKIQTLVEIALPVFFASLLVIIRDLAPAHRFSDATFYPPVDISRMPNIPRNSLLPTGNSLATIDSSNISAQLSATLLDESLTSFGFFKSFEWPLAYAPNNSLVRSVMETVGDKLGLEVRGHGFASEEEMVEYILSNYNGLLTGEKVDFLGGVVFTSAFPYTDTFPKDIKYKIRLKGNPRIKNEDRNPLGPAETWMTDYQYPFFQVPGPRNRNRSDGGSPGYYKEGFLAIQHAISMTISKMITGRNLLDENVIVMRRFPYPPYYDDKFMVALQGWLPLIIMLSFIYPALNIVKSIVHEKERRLKESMKMMGLPNWLHWTAWFIKSIGLLLVTIGLITLVLKSRCFGQSSLAVLEKSDASLFFVFLLVFTITSICFCFLMTVFFSKANSAATGAGIIWFMTYCPYFFLQLRYTTLTRKDKLIACVLSNTAMAFAAQLISMFEGASAGIQWETLFRGVSPDDEFTFGDVLVMLVIDAFVYLIVAFYVEAVYPGEYGVPLPWYFPFTKSYWCGNSWDDTESVADVPENRIPPSEFIEEEPHGLRPGIQIKGLTKMYQNGRVAVNDLNMNMYESQITALLGHNGAGKTTTMSLLTGLFPPTSGTAIVNGFDIRYDMGNVRGSLGLCPQHDVLFDELTVEEHLDFFCKLKGFPSNMVKSETDRMLKALQLEPKKHSQSRTLSGGMKRKLSVGIALCADSKVVMLDEPTSGMDPAARRATWDLLQEEKTGRTILLTTHFMEEADLLGDRIAIMAAGRIQCSGSSLFLKKKYGAGYHLVIVKDKHCNVNRITDLIQKYIPEIEVDQNVGAELSYVLPSDKSSQFNQLFTELEESRVELAISSYGASVTTMEEVFIKVGEKAEEAELTKEANSSALQSEIKSSFHTKDYVMDNFPNQEFHMDRWRKNASYSMTRLVDEDVLKSGCSLRCQQFQAMLVKKSLYTFRNWMLFAAQLVIPVIFLVVCLIVVQTIPGIEDSKPLTATLENYVGTTTTVEINATNDPITAALYSSYINSPDFSDSNKLVFVNARNSSVERFYVRKAEEDVSWVNMHYVVGASFHEKRKAKGKRVITGWFNNQAFHTPALSLNLIHNALLRYYSLIPEYKITVINHPLPYDDISKLNRDTSGSSLGFQVGFNISFGMSFLTASFVIFLVKEKITKAKHLQFVSGVNSVVYWAASFIWDFANYMIPCVGILLTFLAFKEDGYISAEQQGRFVIVFLLFGWAMLPLIYLLSFFFSIPSTGFTRITMFNLFTGLASMITVMILQIPELDLGYAAEVVHWMFLALPSYSLGMAFSNLYTNVKAVEFCSKDIVQMACKTGFMPNPCCKEQRNCGGVPCIQWNTNILGWDGLGVGKELVFLAIDGCVFVFLLFLIETKIFEKLRYWITSRQAMDLKAQNDDPEGNAGMNVMDSDVEREKEYIQLTPVSKLTRENTLIIKDLTKIYPGNFLAVDGMCLGVRRGEVFGLLGINGAGKTTTFKMLTGDETITFGDCFLESFSVKKNIKQVQQRLGYCPQFDAVIEEMTGRETLRMFARLRGVDERRINALIEDLSERLLLTQHINKQVKELSGGNKRKLSTAVALVGDPPIVFLDEPTTGMDPVARRQLWDVITRVRENGQAVVLTSHSMEECEALCTRIAIMVNGQLKCLGSAQHLKSRFGQGYTLIAKVRGATAENPRVPLSRTMSGPAVAFRGSVRQRIAGGQNPRSSFSLTPSSGSPPDMGPLMDFIQLNFPGCQLKDYHQGLVHYHLPENGPSWAKIFGLMESAKNKYSIEDYSVGQTTLEQVFLNFAKSQTTDE